MSALMDKRLLCRLKRTSRLILINLAVLFLLLIVLEGGARFIGSRELGLDRLKLNLQPYMMFSAGPSKNPTWIDTLSGRSIGSTMAFNNYGFSERFDYVMWPERSGVQRGGISESERVILITGGSVVHGVGATSNEMTIAAQLERVLNESQDRYDYRVVNIGMGSWIAYQQFIGLSLFGLPHDPDWVVVMDGHNDAAVPCSHGSGPGNPLGWPKMLYLAGGGEGLEAKSNVLQYLVSNSAAVRLLTGLSEDSYNRQLDRIYFDEEDPDARFRIKMLGNTIAGLDKQVSFYLLAQNNVRQLFSDANILFSSQPLMFDNALGSGYRTLYSPFADAEKAASERSALVETLDGFMAKHGTTKCDTRVASTTLGYFMARSAMALEDAASIWDSEDLDRRVLYANAEMAMPFDVKLRTPHFIDNAHMTDLGQLRTAEYFARLILKHDLGVPYDKVEYARNVLDRTLTAIDATPENQGENSSSVASLDEPDAGGRIYAVEATYGLNCGVPAGNATKSVSDACFGENTCTYTVDVTVLKDPAGGCGKAFDVRWRCSGEQKPRLAVLPPEAGLPPQDIILSCQ